jgi:hypothetical protein
MLGGLLYEMLAVGAAESHKPDARFVGNLPV